MDVTRKGISRQNSGTELTKAQSNGVQRTRTCGQPRVSHSHERGCQIRPKVEAHVPGTDQCQGASVWTVQILGSRAGNDTKMEYKVFLKRLLGAWIPEA